MATCTSIECQKYKHQNLATRIEGQIIIAAERSELLAIDFYGPIPKVKEYVLKHIIFTVDFFSKFVQRATIMAVKRALRKYCFPQFGRPKKILSDQGKQFTHSLWKDTLEDWNVMRILTAIDTHKRTWRNR